ncbi:MAG: class I SAM-dependent methyltransferase [Shimia sp.]|uniref:class I SAM-dependent methyltransferase n=1 Tax=Shimia sp. TaxID=1954381 RepID=UPI0025FC7412|nr:class I SAM-dependent methyltransferase [Shimia sp.]MCH2069171.1 class I SAM-dependent methyltransferase [Shimia sp.]
MAENSLYSDPALISVYDALNAGREDIDYYLSQLPNMPQRVLDIGCGTGRFALELAARGHDVCGVDPAPGMVAFAREKPGADLIEWYVGRCCVVPKSRPFDFIFMTGHAFQCLLSDQDISRLYAEVVARLAPDGVFFAESRNPAVKAWERWCPQNAGPPVALAEGRSVQVTHEVTSVRDELVRFVETYRFAPEGTELCSESCLRFSAKDQLEALAQQVGLGVRHLSGGWDGQVFEEASSPEIILGLQFQN